MKIFKEYNQDQGLLLPPSLDEFVTDDHEALIVNEMVDIIDLSSLLTKYGGWWCTVLPPSHDVKDNHLRLQPEHLQFPKHSTCIEDGYCFHVPLRIAIP